MPKRKHRDYPNDYFSVTEVLDILRKPMLEQWFRNNTAEFCSEESEKGKLIGTQIHDVIEDYILTGTAKIETEYTEEVTNALRSFMLFKKENPVDIVLSEAALTSTVFKFNGTIDAPCPPQLYDWKSTKCSSKDKPPIYWEHKVQAATYTCLWNENYPTQLINQANIVAVAKDKIAYSIETMYEEEINDFFNQVFLPALQITKYKKERHFYGKPVAINC